jgi:hypothetical protein
MGERAMSVMMRSTGMNGRERTDGCVLLFLDLVQLLPSL